MVYADRLFNGLERMDPGPGMVLVAAPGMDSPTFARSVILIVDYSEFGVLGVDLTRRSDIAVYNVLPKWVDIAAKPQALYIGGPLNQQAVVAVGMTSLGVRIEEHPRLRRLANRLVHIDLRAEPVEMAELLDGARFFAGYAEWAPRQLDEEIAHGDWFVAPALPRDVIAPAQQDLWGDVMRRQSMPLALFSSFPAELENN